MTRLLIALGLITLLELTLWSPLVWRMRRAAACLLIVSLAVVSGLLFGAHPAVWTGLLLFFSLYRLVNLLRVLEARLHPKYLYHATLKTSWWLIFSQLAVLGAVGLTRAQSISGLTWLYLLAAGQLVLAATLFNSTRRHLRTTRPAPADKQADSAQPTVSVLIPARNETDDLEACLRSLIASDYEKLEILVLDDCSQNRRTPAIIRGYAHDGVRFISGKVPPKDWLAKNYAYQQLADAANGEWLLFCGVDTRFQPETVRQMIETALTKHKRMISFIPSNQPPPARQLEALLIQPARYTWELALPRRLFRRPPVLSTCWLVTTAALEAAGGFAAIRQSVSPESYLARSAARQNDGYSFLQAAGATDLTSAKSLAEQRDTAVRTRYPQLHRRPELVVWMSLLAIFGLVGPFGGLLGSLLTPAPAGRDPWLLAASAISCLLLIITYARLVDLTYRRFLLRGLWTLPLVAVYDIGLLNYSMWCYEFREVIWKGRDVCVPVMQVIPRLPGLPATPDSGKRR